MELEVLLQMEVLVQMKVGVQNKQACRRVQPLCELIFVKSRFSPLTLESRLSAAAIHSTTLAQTTPQQSLTFP